ncbi:LysR family transcriptional regulator [Asaia spathodeae]|uniref:LysR family transcriptional regulator n=1 Tax=Asaia spathodeae TaxID=657016 RepID=UPI002FC347DD
MTDNLIFRLKFRQLLLLRQIDLEPALNRAARSLNLSQPTASKLLQDMETDLDVQLFERHAHGLTPTRAGSVAIRHARQILADLGRLRHDLKAVQHGLSGTVSIGAISAPLHEIILPILADLAEAQPDISVTLHVNTSHDLMEMMQAGRIDLAVCRPVDNLSAGSLTVEELAPERLVVVAGARNPILQNPPSSLAELIDARWIVHTAPSPMRQAIESAFTMARLPLPLFPVELTSIYATIDLLQQSTLLAVLPRSVFNLFEQTEILRELPVVMPDLLSPYSLVRLRDRPFTPAMAYLYDEIKCRAIGLSDSVIK